MAARFLFSVATICCVAIFVQESSGSCIRRGGHLDNPQYCMSSCNDGPSPCGCRQPSRCCGDNKMEVQLPRKSCPMHGYTVDAPPEHESEPCKAYGVMVAIPKPPVKACFVSSSHKYEVEKTMRERMEQRRAYGIAVATPRKAAVRSPDCQVHNYVVETPKKAKKEDTYAYGVAVVNVPGPEPCLPCMEDDNTPDEGLYEPPGPCCPCVDDEPGLQVHEPHPVSLPRSGGCKSCSMCSGAQAGGYYYGETRKSSSRCDSCHSYEQRYEGRRDGRVLSPSLSYVEDVNGYLKGDEEESDSEYEKEDPFSMICLERSSKERGECHSMSYDNQEDSEEENLGKAFGGPRTTGNFYRPSRCFQGATDEEGCEDCFGVSSIAHSTFGCSGCPSSSNY